MTVTVLTLGNARAIAVHTSREEITPHMIPPDVWRVDRSNTTGRRRR